jgi:glycosyltransferase involved in cell wall biosynthesis
MGCAVARLPIDAFFFPAVYSFFPLLCRVPTAVTFHDAIAEHHPDLIFSGFRTRWLWGLKTWLARRQASLVLTVTETARAQIASAFGLPAANIHVITEGPHAAFRPIHDRHVRQGVLDKYGLPIDRPLILYVGGISPHKNLEGLLQALCRLRVATPISWHLVLVGDYASDSFLGCYHRLKELATQLGLSDHTTFTGYIPNEDLAVLYNTAVFLVLPSFSEGFGLPLVEAMACGTPVAASSRGAIPEVLGSAGVLFDPEDHAEMAAVLRRLLEDEPLRTQSRAEGLKRVTRYTWSASAHTTVKLLEDMVDAAKAS